MRRVLLPLLLLACCFAQAIASQPTAAEVMNSAYAKARKEKKNVMVIFHASWCGWCKRLNAFLDKTPEGGRISAAYVVVHLDVLESKDKKDLENAGGELLMKEWGGENAGLPFTVVLDAKGKKLITSLRTVEGKAGENIGYPAAPVEIAHFIAMLKATSKLSPQDVGAVEKWLVENAPKS